MLHNIPDFEEINEFSDKLLQRPIKAPSTQISFDDPRIVYPAIASVKYDGFRMIVTPKGCYSPNLKWYPNVKLKSYLSNILELSQKKKLVFDGEMFGPDLTFQEHQTKLMSYHNSLDGLIFHCFDVVKEEQWGEDSNVQYWTRLTNLQNVLKESPCQNVVIAEYTFVNTAAQAAAHYEKLLSDGAEGMILRSPTGKYKHGRCTLNKFNMLKFKHFATLDAKILEVIPRRQMREDVERTLTVDGKLERVYTQDSYVTTDIVGAFKLVDASGRVFTSTLGRGFSLEDKKQLWQQRDSLVGSFVEVKHMPHGAKDKPRIGNIIRLRLDK